MKSKYLGILVVSSGCTLVYPGDEHQRARDASTSVDASSDAGDGAVDAGGDATVVCPDPDADDDLHDAIACGGDDCDDTNDAIHPGAPLVCGNGIDEVCGAAVQQTFGLPSGGVLVPATTVLDYLSPYIETGVVLPPRVSTTSTALGDGFFVVTGIRDESGIGQPFFLRSSPLAPTTFGPVAESPVVPDLSISAVTSVVRSNGGGGEPDVEFAFFARSPDDTLLAGYVGSMDVGLTDVTVDAFTAITTSSMVPRFRPGMTMTGQPPRWVLGEVDSAAVTDRINGCVKGSAATCMAAGSTLNGTPSTDPTSMVGTPSGHVVYRTGDGGIAIWDTMSAFGTASSIEPYTSPASSVSGRPGVAQIGPAIGSPAVHSYVVSVPYRNAANVEGLTLLRVTCQRGASPGACTLASGTSLTLAAGESFAGPSTVVAYGGERFLVLAGVQTMAGARLRAFVGRYDVAGATITIDRSVDVASFAPSDAHTLTDVGASFLERPGAASTLSIVFTRGLRDARLESTALSFCEMP